MTYSKYTTIVLEAVTQGSKVSGCPSKFLSLLKTTLLLLLVIVNVSVADEIEEEYLAFVQKFNEVSPIKLRPQEFESALDVEARVIKQTDEVKDLALNKAEITEGKYWIDGRWLIRKDSRYERVAGGWIYHEEEADKPTRQEENPVIRKGNNLVTFKMDGCEAGFQFEAFKGSYKGVSVGPISLSKEKLKQLMYRE
jgi:hypothetical protein